MSNFRAARVDPSQLYRRRLSPIMQRQRGLRGLGAGENAFTSSGTATAIGAGASMVKSKNPTTSFAAQGASTGAAVGSVVPGIGTVIGAVAGAVIGAIGGAFIGSKRPESELWDNYKKMAGNAAGHEYDNAFRNGAFVGLMRLGKNTFPPRAKGGYGPNDDAKFLRDMVTKIAEAFRSGVLAPRDADAPTIFSKVVGPWIAQWGEEKNPDWRRWENQIVMDQIDAWLYDQPIIATSYTTATWPQPRVTALASEILAKYQTPTATTPAAAAPVPQPVPAVVSPIAGGTALIPAGSSVLPAPPTNLTSADDPRIAAYIKALQDQGASQQQSFNAALAALSGSGVAPTQAVQSAVADQVQTASAGGGSKWLVLGAAALAALFAFARPARHK